MTTKKLYQFDQYILDAQNNKLLFKSEVVSSDDKLIRALYLLCQAYPNAVGKDELLEKLWPAQVVTEWSLSKLISEIRLLLGDNGKDQDFIKTVRGKGFRMNTQVSISEVSDIQPIAGSQTSKAGSRDPKRQYVIPLSVLTFIVIATISLIFYHPNTLDAKIESPLRVAVLPVDNMGDSIVHDWVKYGIMAMVSEQLGQYQSIQTLAVDKVLSEINGSRKPSFENVCGQLGCDKLIQLSFIVNGNETTLTFEIHDAKGTSVPISSSSFGAIETTNQVLELLARKLIPETPEILPLATILSNNEKANREYVIGLHELHSGELKDARQYLEMALERDSDFFWAKAHLAEVTYREGDYAVASSQINELDSLKLDNDKRYFLTQLSSNILYSQGNIQGSLETSLALLDNPHVKSDPMLLGNQQMNIGTSFQAMGENQKAIKYLNEAQTSYAKAAYGSGEGKVMFNLANVYLASTEFNKAIEHYRLAKDLFLRFGLTGYSLFARHQIATTSIQVGKIQDSERELNQLIQEYRQIGDTEGEYTALSDLAYISLLQKDYTESIKRAAFALAELENTQFSYLKYQVISIATKANLMLGNVEDAINLQSQLNEDDWNDPRPSYVFLKPHIEYLKNNLDLAFQMANDIKVSLGENWTDEHEKVLMQFEQAMVNKKQGELAY